MKNLSRSLTRSRSCQAFVVLSADNTDSPTGLYTEPQIRVRHGEFGIDFDQPAGKKVWPPALPEDRFTFRSVL